jgi:hypothetical protein
VIFDCITTNLLIKSNVRELCIHISSGGKDYYYCTTNMAEQEEWMEALRKAPSWCDRIKAGAKS